MDVSKAIKIFEGFEQSKQLWAFLVERGLIGAAEDFIKSVPHMSFVLGEKDTSYLNKRFENLSAHHFFSGMEITHDWEQAKEWAPLLAEGRDDFGAICADA